VRSATYVTFREELERVRALYPNLDIVLEGVGTEQVPANLEALAQSVLVEAVRNAHKHSRATFVKVSLRNDGGTFVLEVRNDGAPPHNDGGGGVGLRLATLEALQHDGVLEYGESEPGAWQVRLVVPTAQ
jgi:signal transduction histidine kinase